MRNANRWRSFGYAFADLTHVLRTQRNLPIHLAIAALVVLGSHLLKLGGR